MSLFICKTFASLGSHGFEDASQERIVFETLHVVKLEHIRYFSENLGTSGVLL